MSSLTNFSVVVFVARSLGPHEFGIFSLALAVFIVVALAVAAVGIPLLAARFARGIGREQIEARVELNAQLVDGIRTAQRIFE